MNLDRTKLLDKIRALLSKTTENGCTEYEALAALDKAREMMDAYEVTPEDVALKGEMAAVLNCGASDPHGTKAGLAVTIAAFCDCKVWRAKDGIRFCGLDSDAALAVWLLDTLSAFVQRELAKHLWTCMAPKGARRTIINGFVGGCCRRINDRLKTLSLQSNMAKTSNGRALVVAKSALVNAKMSELGLHLSRSRRTMRRIDRNSYAAGQSAGDRATFGRPVSNGGGVAMIGCR